MTSTAVHVLGGGGSIGLLVAWHLTHGAKLPVTLLLRSQASAQAIRKTGKIHLDYRGNGASGPPSWLHGHAAGPPDQPVSVECVSPRNSSDPFSTISRLVVATKAVDTTSALLSVSSRMSPDCEIVMLQNGMLGVYPEVHQRVIATGRIPAQASLAVGSVTHGAYRTGPGAVVQSCSGTISLAPVDITLPSLTQPGQAGAWDRLRAAEDSGPAASSKGSLLHTFLSTPGLGAQLVPSHAQLLRALHLKLAVNCGVNPGTALLGCLNDAYASDPHGRRLAHSVCSELFGLYGQELLGLASAEELTDYVLEIAAGTGKNKNSMLQDVLAGRPTEIDFLNGYVASFAEAQGKQAPVNRLLHTLIKAKENLATAVG